MSHQEFLHQLLHLPMVMSPRLSPDGRWVAFIWYRVHENGDVFVVPADGSIAPVALTHTPEFTELVDWSSDSRAVIVSEDHDNDERSRLFRIDLFTGAQGEFKPGVMIPLTEDRPPYFLRGGSLSPDGKTLYYGANYDFATQSPILPTWIYHHDLESGQRTAIVRPQQPAYTVPSLNQPGTHLIYTRKDRHPSGTQIYLADVQGQEDGEILNFGEQNKVFASWFPDGEHILVLSEATERTRESGQAHRSLGVYHWPRRQLRWLIDNPQRQVETAWVSDDGALIVDEIRQAAHTITYFLPPPGGWSLERLDPTSERKFPRLSGNLVPLGRSADGAWVAQYYASNSPTELVCLRLEDSKIVLTSLTRAQERTSFDLAQLAPAESYHWASEDGLQIQGWLYRANPNQGQAVIFVHGGPTAHSEDRLNPQIQYFVRRGFNVLDVNYRGSTGFGLKFKNLIKVDGWGGGEQADIAWGARALIEAGLAGPGKVAVTGTSYGGYSSWCQITHTPPELIGAAAPICGMTDLVVDYETTRPDLRPLSAEMLGGTPQEAPERYFERSPINFVQSIRGKLLIVQGAQDPNVTPENVRQVVQRLEASQIPYELLVFEDEGHGIIKPTNQEELFTRLADFFEAAFQ